MPRPTAAQFLYGSATVVISALALLLLFRTESGIGVAAVGTASLVLGLLVALVLPAPARPARRAAPPATARTHRTVGGIEITTARRQHVGEHSLHR